MSLWYSLSTIYTFLYSELSVSSASEEMSFLALIFPSKACLVWNCQIKSSVSITFAACPSSFIPSCKPLVAQPSTFSQSSTRETEPVGWIYGWMDGWIEIYCKELAYTILEPGQASLRAGHQGGQAGAKRPSVGRASSLGLRNDRTRPTQMLLGNFSYLKTTGYTF